MRKHLHIPVLRGARCRGRISRGITVDRRLRCGGSTDEMCSLKNSTSPILGVRDIGVEVFQRVATGSIVINPSPFQGLYSAVSELLKGRSLYVFNLFRASVARAAK